MRYLLTLIITLSFACGNTPNKVEIPEKSAIPWENLDTTERKYYEETLGCPKATELVNVAKGWDLVIFDDGTKNPEQVAPNRYMMFKIDSTGALAAFFQFRVSSEGKIIVEGVVLLIGEVKVILLDYYVMRDLKEGKITPEMETDTVFASATGEFFCLHSYQDN